MLEWIGRKLNYGKGDIYLLGGRVSLITSVLASVPFTFCLASNALKQW